MRFRSNHSGAWGRVATPALLLVIGFVTAAHVVRAGEIVPSIGLTRAIDGGEDAKAFGGLAIRGSLTPLFMTEVGVSYRSESRFNDQLKVRMWPITASLYLKPVRMLYAGGGVGWYQTTFDYAESVPIKDETKQEFGVHLGGGFQVPLSSRAGIDLGGRYVMMRQQESHLVPDKFDPDFWTTSVGLAIKF